MGEKYDDCYDLRPTPWWGGERILRLRDPSGAGFPPDEYGMMRSWGAPGQTALRRYLDRPAATIAEMSSEVQTGIASAGSDAGAQLAAGRAAVERINAGYEAVSQQTAQSQMTLQMLSREDTVPTGELADVARSGARSVKQAVTDHVGPLENLIADVFGTTRDAALTSVGAQAEAAVNRVGELAYTSTSGLYREVFRRGLAEVPDPGAANG
ncbi:MAG: hypothetical protein WDA60_08125 [Acidimicrobiia bacterium]|jgi:hypothetical protein